MAKNKIGAWLLIIIVIGAAYLTFDTFRGKEKMDQKVLIIGIDGMDHKVTKSLMAAGKLPNFQILADKGSFLRLDTVTPPESPVAWVSISTGLNPGKHNIFDFIRRDPQRMIPELSLAKPKEGLGGTSYESYVKGTPFWKLTSDAGIDTTIIRWPVTFPPEKVSGKMFSGLGVPDIKGFLSGYSFYTSDKTFEAADKEKVISVSVEDSQVNTFLTGPRTIKNGEIIDVTTPLVISLTPSRDHDAVFAVDGQTYQLNKGEWSPWIRATFKVSLLKKITATFKVYLIDTEPFQMYMTTLQIDPENPVLDISYPGSYSSELAKEIGPYYTLGMPEETDGYVNGRLDRKAFLEQTREIEEERTKMFWKEFNLFKTKKQSLLAFVFDTSDRLQHVFWNEKVLEDDRPGLAIDKALLDYYQEKDAFLGKLLGQLDENTRLFIISDHGITSFERAVSINNWLVENGFMTVNKELDGKEDPLFQTVDWTKTKAYSLGFTSIYVNAEGRESKGIVKDREATVTEMIDGLEELKDPKTGKKVIYKAYRKEELYSGGYLDNAPDIIIGFNPGYRMSWQTAVGGFGPETIIDNEKKWSGDHLVDPSFVPGVLFSNMKINQEKASLLDIAPTILGSFNIKQKLDGEDLLQ
ncbi:hypothetical protein COV20_01965 [Candidatus Woesearchaeota archaeon CG10_big_fil_rev_8_21_14_0_10_45_16]|nr:MAG: hypothetical protein COV20_01965 [Candidatus Woesearchaeota archaeon CG10_big_fil_rev_8_21_14_0_10_45_16]